MSRRDTGFTLIELMVVVAIVGVLAATAITNYRSFQMRSKMSEVRTNLSAIATAENAYFAEYGVFAPAASTPGGVLNGAKRPWAGGGIASFDAMGFAPEGSVAFNYGVDTNGAFTNFTAGAAGDLDFDGVTSDLGYVHPATGAALGQASTVAPACIGAGVFDPANPLGTFNAVGACTLLDGRSEF